MALVKYNNNSLSAVTAASSLPTGAMTLIKEQTASSSATISFVDGTSDVVLDSTYPIYVFKWINIHPSSDNIEFQVNFRDGSTAYDATKTTTFFYADHREDDAGASLSYDTGRDLAQSTGVQHLGYSLKGDADADLCGQLNLYNPSSTTFVKHFIARTAYMHSSSEVHDSYIAGYCNVTAAIDGVQFAMSTGTFDGTFKLYGVS